MHVGNCADSAYAINASADLGIYPRSILWSEDPIVQRTQRNAVAEAILSVKRKMRTTTGATKCKRAAMTDEKVEEKQSNPMTGADIREDKKKQGQKGEEK